MDVRRLYLRMLDGRTALAVRITSISYGPLALSRFDRLSKSAPRVQVELAFVLAELEGVTFLDPMFADVVHQFCLLQGLLPEVEVAILAAVAERQFQACRAAAYQGHIPPRG